MLKNAVESWYLLSATTQKQTIKPLIEFAISFVKAAKETLFKHGFLNYKDLTVKDNI